MPIAVYLVLAAFAGAGMGGFGVHSWVAWRQDVAEADAREAQEKIEVQTKEALQAADNHLIDMQAAFDVGESKAKVEVKTVYIKGQTYVQNTPSVNNPVCVIDGDGVSIINGQITSLRAAAAAALGLDGVSGAGTYSGNLNVYGTTVPAVSGQSVPTSGVPAQAPKSDSASGVPGQSLQGHPKPKPVN